MATETWDGIDEVAAAVAAASSPTDLFGPTAIDESATKAGQALFRRLAWLCHPDHQPSERRLVAEATFATLSLLWADWQAPSPPRPGSDPGTGSNFTLLTISGAWAIGEQIGSDELCDLYAAERLVGSGWRPATATDARTTIDIPRDSGDNDLLEREASALTALAGGVDPRFSAYFPRLIESIRHRDASGQEVRINAISMPGGLRSLAHVARAYPDGLDPRDAAWMWRRLLVALGAAHRAGVVHGAIVPEHVLIHPADHGVVLTGWYFSAERGQTVPAMLDRYHSWYPTEVELGQAAVPATDISMVSRLVGELMGPRTPSPVRRFLSGCTRPHLSQRPDDAWRLLAELDDLLERLWGPRTFRPFHLPNHS